MFLQKQRYTQKRTLTDTSFYGYLEIANSNIAQFLLTMHKEHHIAEFPTVESARVKEI